jgi:hypothetical protein
VRIFLVTAGSAKQMAVVTIPSGKPHTVEWRRPSLVLIFVLLGLMSVAAVARAKIDCRSDALLLASGSALLATAGGKLLASGPRQCRLELDGFHLLNVPQSAAAVFGY